MLLGKTSEAKSEVTRIMALMETEGDQGKISSWKLIYFLGGIMITFSCSGTNCQQIVLSAGMG